MKNARMLALPGLILAGALVLAGCGDTETPAMSPSPSDSAMMDDGSMDDGMMTPSPSASDAMMDDN